MAHMFLRCIRPKMFMKESHTALFIAPTGIGETHTALDLLESEYKNHFDFITKIISISLQKFAPHQNITRHTGVENGFGLTLKSS